MHPPRSIAPLILLALALPAHAGNPDLSGAWQAWLCPQGLQRDSGRCSTFVLELHQKDGRICGAHTFSTADASRVDEGAAPSVVGKIAGDTAEVAVTSTVGGTPLQVRAELARAGAGLQWLRQDAPRGEYLLPQKARLTKARKKSLFAPVFEQELRAICLSHFTMAEQNAARQQAPAQPASPSPAPGPQAPAPGK